MEILAGSWPVGFQWSSRASSRGQFRVSATSLSSRARSSKWSGKIGVSSGESRTGGAFVPLSAPGRSFHSGCWRLIPAASSGKSGKNPKTGGNNKGGGRAKSNPEKKLVSEKKQAKPNVWSSEFPSGKSAIQSSVAKSQRESSDGGGRGRGARETVNVVDDDVRVRSFNAATSNVAASEGRKIDMDDTMFLRYLSPLLPVVEETVLQPEESVPNPLFSTFCSNSSGVWRGVGATFSPITGDFEPVYLDEDKQNVYDVRVLSTVENLRTTKDGAALPPEQQSLYRKVSWSLEKVLGIGDEESTATVQGGDDGSRDDVDEEVDELGYMEDDEDTEDEYNSDWEIVLAEPREIDERWEKEEEVEGFMEEIEDTGFVREDDTDWNSMWDRREVLDGGWEDEGSLPAGESGSNLTAEPTTSLGQSSTSTSDEGPPYDEGHTEDTPWEEDVMEEDVLTWEPGLVFFEDGAYSRGPSELLAEASSSSREYFNAFTFKIEQCLVSGGHKRLRTVHTVSIDEEEKIEVLRMAVYEDEWMGPCNMKSISDAGGHRLELFSERARHSPEDVVGKWKVFQVEALAMHPVKASDQGSFVFSCKETSIQREFPAMPKLTLEEDEAVDLSDFAMSWLTGNVSTYVSLSDTGALTFGVGWVCEDRTRLVMERAYGGDGKLLHVNSKSEIRVVR